MQEGKKIAAEMDFPKPVDTASSTISGSADKSLISKQSQQSSEIIIEGDVRIVTSIETESDVLSVKYTPGHQYLAVGMSNGEVNLYTMPSGTLVRTLVQADCAASPVTCMKHGNTELHQNTVTVSYADGTITCWDIHGGIPKYSIKEKRQILGLAYHPQSPKLITFGEDARIFLYDEESSMLEAVFESTDVPEQMDGHVSRIFAGCFNPAIPHEFITGGWDNTIQIWDIRSNQSLRHMSGVHMCGDGLDINKSGKQIASFAWQKTNSHQLWDYSTGKILMNFEVDNFPSMLYCGKFLPKDVMVMGGTDQNLIRVVDKSTLTAVCRIRGLPNGIYSLDSGLASRKLQQKKAECNSNIMPNVCFSSGRKVFEFEFNG